MSAALPYDLTRFTTVDSDGWLRVWCRVTWTPRGGQSVTVTGHHLDMVDDRAVLTCGMYEVCEQLGLPEPDDPHALRISALVDRQLALRTCAELSCPEGHFLIELVKPPPRRE